MKVKMVLSKTNMFVGVSHMTYPLMVEYSKLYKNTQWKEFLSHLKSMKSQLNLYGKSILVMGDNKL